MAQANYRAARPEAKKAAVQRGVREGALFVVGALALYLLVALGSYQASDPGWSHSRQTDVVHNSGGVVGAYFADLAYYLVGYLAFLFPLMAAYLAWMLFRGGEATPEEDKRHMQLRVLGCVLTVGAGAALAEMHFKVSVGLLPLNSGGLIGDLLSAGLIGAFSFVGATLFLVSLFLAGVTLFTGLSWIKLMDVTGRYALNFARWAQVKWGELLEALQARQARKTREQSVKAVQAKTKHRVTPKIEPEIQPIKQSERVEKERQVPLFRTTGDGSLPPLSLLDEATPSKHAVSKESLEALSRLVEMKLADFGVEVQVVQVNPGPVITRFEMQPAAGVKVSQISNLAKDLARALSTISVRVVEVIPGKSTVGLEIPNEHREIVRLSEVLRSQAYDEHSSPLTLALGKDISGQPTVADLAKMPHLLVAGTTGSGKSVAINAMVLSLLYKASPKDVRLIMVDPKMLELSVYQGIPHLLAPVVTDMKEAANALRWCVAEMERRYRMMAALGVRNLSGCNRKINDAIEAGAPIKDPLFKPELPDVEYQVPTLEPLPYIVVFIDELADMMMVVGKKVEELIARLAQKARASGIHLILATQRPSVDVITGLIKANIPTRIAFQVSSKIDSRTILDQMGAEQLLGHGDMLYLAPGTGVPVRVHGAFVDDHEVHKVVSELKKQGAPKYVDDILQGATFPGDPMAETLGAESEHDALYDEAVAFITQARRVSVSSVQRRFKIGYNRAARIVEEMERDGVVTPMMENGNREVLAPPPPEL